MAQDIPNSPTPAVPARRHAAALLGSGVSQSETARQIGRSRKTVARWLRDSAFAAAVEQHVKTHVQEASAVLFAGLTGSAKALIRIQDDLEHPSAALRAAQINLAKHGLLAPAPPPRNPDVRETVSLGGSLKVLTPEEAAKLVGGDRVIVALPDPDSSSNDRDLAGPRPDATPDRPPAADDPSHRP